MIRRSSTWDSSFPWLARMAALDRSARRCNSAEYAAMLYVRAPRLLDEHGRSDAARRSLHAVSNGPGACTAVGRRLRYFQSPQQTVIDNGSEQNMNISRGRCLVALTTVMAVFVAMPTPAQTSDLEEIVVTARKRDETAQNVPITMNVFTAQEIQSAGIYSPSDFVAMVPNMTMVAVQNVGNSFITIRGISQARNSEPSVAVLVDGVLETNPYEFNQELYDVRQIEVLKGPQGALYGRDAIGGAIIINTADPSDHFEGTGRVGCGQRSVGKGPACPRRPDRFRRDA